MVHKVFYGGSFLLRLKAFSTKVVEEHGVIDILINNAGYFYGPQEKVTGDTLNFEEQWKQIDICALGPLRVRLAIPQLTYAASAPWQVTSALFNAGGLKEGSKAVIITSQAGSVEWRLTQNPEGGDYGHHMSRAACNIMGVLLSQELKSKGVAIVRSAFAMRWQRRTYTFPEPVVAASTSPRFQ